MMTTATVRPLASETDDASVTTAWNDPAQVAQRHGAGDAGMALQNIADALSELAAQAAGR